MYDLFHPEGTTNSGGLALPALRRIRDGLLASIDKVRQYRAINPQTLNAAHPLIRLLQSVNVSLALEPEYYVDRVTDITFNLARVLGYTSPVSVGHVFSPSMFYGTGVSDLILATDEPFDLTNIEQTWPSLRPIRVIAHPLTDLRLHVPDGKFTAEQPGVAVIAINIPMLALQYRMWRKWERGSLAAESPMTVAQFLMGYPLPSMLYSHLDVAIFNRIFSLAFDVPMPKIRSRHPFFLIDWESEMDQVIREYLVQMHKRRANMDQMIHAMPTVGYPSRYDTLRLPEMPFTYQTMALVIAARVMPVMFHLQFIDQTQNPQDFETKAYLQRFFRKVENTSVLRTNLAEPVRTEVLEIIQSGILPFLEA